jgi:hypothetical protein
LVAAATPDAAAAPDCAETVTVTVAVADAVQELTVNAGTTGQFDDEAPEPAATALALFGGEPVAAALLLVEAGTVAVA